MENYITVDRIKNELADLQDSNSNIFEEKKMEEQVKSYQNVSERLCLESPWTEFAIFLGKLINKINLIQIMTKLIRYRL